MPPAEAELIPELVHATCVTIDEVGILLRGPSGAGKSDLALRLIDRGAMLVGDDYLHVTAEGGTLRAEVPAAIAGRIEVRGVGIVTMPYQSRAMIGLVIDLGEGEDRLPEPESVVIAGISLPCYRLNPLPASAPIKVELMVSHHKERT
ncbi:HPr kinase/phosphorylase [Sphingomonas sp. NPDC019816]|uniref:HPr kinase/phosphorylase n=1 Tax=Sphingomonas sp. NPDC019816 TaxID=3390679 RepID=UPI003D054A55